MFDLIISSRRNSKNNSFYGVWLRHIYLWPNSGVASSVTQNTTFKELTRGEQSVAFRPRVVADTASKIATATTKCQYVPLPMLF